jgi:transposase
MPKGKSLSVDMRKLIIDKFRSGERQSDVAKQLNLNRSVISKTISLYNQRRSLVNVPKSGRPRKTARITDRKIAMLSRQNPFWDAVKIKRKIPNVSLSVRSIDVDLMKLDFMEENQHRNRSFVFLLKIEEPSQVCKRTFELDAAPIEKHPIL